MHWQYIGGIIGLMSRTKVHHKIRACLLFVKYDDISGTQSCTDRETDRHFIDRKEKSLQTYLS